MQAVDFDAVFFDFGGVVLSSPFEAFSVYEQRAGLPPNAVRTINATNPDANAWAQFERNELSVEEFIERFEAEGRELGFDIDGVEVLRCLDGELRPEMVEVVGRCQQIATTAMLTNNVVSMSAAGFDERSGGSAIGTDGVDMFTEVLGYFDHIIESSAVGVRKPERRFYEIACEVAQVEPSRVVFLDDLGINLKPARELGMTTIKVVDPAMAIDDLEAVMGVSLRVL